MPSRPTPPSLFPETPTKSASGGWITAHCDGGARGNPGPAGYGAEITGPDGAVIAELSEYLGHRTNNYAEYAGLLASLQYALDHHHPRLRVISDSELMVKQIQGKYKVNSPDLKPLWQEAKNRIARLEAFEISHALRHKNKDADRLANEAMDRGMKRPHAPGQPAPPPLKATPYPTKSGTPPDPYAKPDTMLRGFTKDGVVHLLGGATLPDGVFVKIIRE
jgi:ribonuclease HI